MNKIIHALLYLGLIIVSIISINSIHCRVEIPRFRSKFKNLIIKNDLAFVHFVNYNVLPNQEEQDAKPTLPDPPKKVTAPVTSVVVKVPIKKSVVVKPKPRIYTVKSGDSLWTIARDQLGDASRHLELAELNKDTLGGNSDSLMLGQKIKLPPK